MGPAHVSVRLQLVGSTAFDVELAFVISDVQPEDLQVVSTATGPNCTFEHASDLGALIICVLGDIHGQDHVSGAVSVAGLLWVNVSAEARSLSLTADVSAPRQELRTFSPGVTPSTSPSALPPRHCLAATLPPPLGRGGGLGQTPKTRLCTHNRTLPSLRFSKVSVSPSRKIFLVCPPARSTHTRARAHTHTRGT